MKKLVTVCLTVFCLTFLLAGCRAGNTNTGANNVVNSPLPAGTVAPVATDIDTDELYDDNNDTGTLGEIAGNVGNSVEEGAEAAGNEVKEGAEDVKNAVTNPTSTPR